MQKKVHLNRIKSGQIFKMNLLTGFGLCCLHCSDGVLPRFQLCFISEVLQDRQLLYPPKINMTSGTEQKQVKLDGQDFMLMCDSVFFFYMKEMRSYIYSVIVNFFVFLQSFLVNS